MHIDVTRAYFCADAVGGSVCAVAANSSGRGRDMHVPLVGEGGVWHERHSTALAEEVYGVNEGVGVLGRQVSVTVALVSRKLGCARASSQRRLRIRASRGSR